MNFATLSASCLTNCPTAVTVKSSRLGTGFRGGIVRQSLSDNLKIIPYYHERFGNLSIV